MAPNTKTGRRVAGGREGGFTLAAVMVIMSVMMIFVAYTVPKQWSVLMQRDREQQTIFIMQQYAKACENFRKKNNTYPVSMQQLVEAQQPRFLRCPKDGCIDPLTGQVDWFVIPQAQAPAPGGGTAPPGVAPAPGLPPGGTTSTAPGAAAPTVPQGIPIKDYAGGPFVGIKPNKTGPSFMILNGADHYEQWMYTALDYQQERTARQQAAVKVWQ
jgi:type II secretory pathway pseudopilin PulG